MVKDLVEGAVRKLDQTVLPPGRGWESAGYNRRITGRLGVDYRLQRRMYRRRRQDGTWEECCPLDKQLGLAARERFSPGARSGPWSWRPAIRFGWRWRFWPKAGRR